MVRLTERETAAWCVVRGIDYLVDECPMAAGNKHLGYKAALNAIEAESPGIEGRVLLQLHRATWHRCWSGHLRDEREALGQCCRVRRTDVG